MCFKNQLSGRLQQAITRHHVHIEAISIGRADIWFKSSADEENDDYQGLQLCELWLNVSHVYYEFLFETVPLNFVLNIGDLVPRLRWLSKITVLIDVSVSIATVKSDFSTRYSRKKTWFVVVSRIITNYLIYEIMKNLRTEVAFRANNEIFVHKCFTPSKKICLIDHFFVASSVKYTNRVFTIQKLATPRPCIALLYHDWL